MDLYTQPLNGEPARIWIEAGLENSPQQEFKIRMFLNMWAAHNAVINIKPDGHHIQWVAPSGYITNCRFDVFQRWFLLACQKFIPPSTIGFPDNVMTI
jgi:hypothetical protein